MINAKGEEEIGGTTLGDENEFKKQVNKDLHNVK